MELEKNPKTRKLYKRLLALEDKVGARPFPEMRRVKQISPSHCGPAVLEALFSHLGHKISQTAVVRTLRAQNKIKKTGLSVKDLAKAANALSKGKYVFWRKSHSTMSQVAKVINEYKYPVGVEWQGVFYEFEDEDSGHYAIITGIDREKGILRIADPFPEFAGIDRKFEIKFLLKRWWDVNIIKGRKIRDEKMMFVITPKSETWPKKLGMRQ